MSLEFGNQWIESFYTGTPAIGQGPQDTALGRTHRHGECVLSPEHSDRSPQSVRSHGRTRVTVSGLRVSWGVQVLEPAPTKSARLGGR